MKKNEYANKINMFITKLTREFVKNKRWIDLKCVFLTGSFASWLKERGSHEPSWKALPDVNYYPLIEGTEEDIITVENLLLETIFNVTKILKEEEGLQYNIVIDLHPFTISPYKPVFELDIINIQLTTRIVNLTLKEMYPLYSWYGWLDNYIVVYPQNDDPLQELTHMKELKRDGIWLRNMYLALLSYRNVLQILPLYTREKCHIFDESFRYLKELMKDGVSLTLTEEEYERGLFYKILDEWRNKIVPFYTERYGEEAAKIISLIRTLDENYVSCRENIEDPTQLIKAGLTLDNILFEQGFKKRLREIPIEKKELDGIFQDLPLWW